MLCYVLCVVWSLVFAVVRCCLSLFVAVCRCLLIDGVCCSLFVVCCLLFVVCCLLFAVCCVLIVVSCLLFVAV